MKLVMTLLVRDEEDIIDANIAFHLASGVDFIIAMDNLSVDRTPDILRRYEERGRLLALKQQQDNYAQYEWVTGMARCAAVDFGADWVINSDADEFWWTESGDLKRALAEVPMKHDAVVVQRTNFVPRRQEGEFFADTMTIRERQSLNALGNPLPPKVCHRGFPDIEVIQGNHAVSRRGQPLGETEAAIEILHYPMRRYEQFANKISKGGSAVRRNTDPAANVSTWIRLLGVLEAGQLQQHYWELVPDEEAIAAGLHNGRYLEDERLRNRLAQLRSAPHIPILECS